MGKDAERQVAMRGKSRVNNKDIGADNGASKRPLLVAAFFVHMVGITRILLAKSESPFPISVYRDLSDVYPPTIITP